MWNVKVTPLYSDDMLTIISNLNDKVVERAEHYKQLGVVIYEHFELFAYIRKVLKCMYHVKHGNILLGHSSYW